MLADVNLSGAYTHALVARGVVAPWGMSLKMPNSGFWPALVVATIVAFSP